MDAVAVYRASLPIPAGDIDPFNRLKVSAIFNYLQAAAASHAETWNLGYAALQRSGLFWVLAWVRVELDALPAYRDVISLETWAHGRHRLFSLRDFRLLNAAGVEFGRVRSGWLLVDAASKRVTSLDRLPGPVPYQAERASMAALPEKAAPPEGDTPVYERTIRYVDLDMNRHTNNARYVEFALDCYALDWHAAHRLRSIEVWFKAESKYGDRLAYTRSTPPGSTSRHLLAARRGDEICFQAALEWQEG